MKQLAPLGTLCAILVGTYALAQEPPPPPPDVLVVETIAVDDVRAFAGLTIGEKAAAPQWERFAQGEPVAFAAVDAPNCTIYAFYTGLDGANRFVGEAAYLTELQRRFGERGLAVVAVVGEVPKDLKPWTGCRVVVDRELATSTAWFGDPSAAIASVVVGKDGTVAFAGSCAGGLVDALAATLAGKPDHAGERAASSTRQMVPTMFDNLDPAQTTSLVTSLLEHAPHDGEARGWLYANLATRTNDQAPAEHAFAAACEQLAGEARPLAAFADLALRAAPHAAGCGATLGKLLEPLAKQAPADPQVQLALLRALMASGDSRAVVRQAFHCRKVALGSAADAIAYAMILAADQNPMVHRDLVQQALERAEKLGASPSDLVRGRYVAARRCADDAAGAREMLDGYLGKDEIVLSLNNTCWYAMTELETMGRFDAFALGVAERMVEQKESLQYNEFDTAALAMYLNGRIAEAVDLQTTAIDKGGRGNPEYEQRLARYKAAAAAAPR